jgi:Tol biopolymer transport system component
VQLTSGTSDAQPRLSADGKKIFFNSFLSTNPRNWVQDLATGRRTNLTTSTYERHPAPNADASRVAYQTRDPATSKLAVYVVEVKWPENGMPQPGVPRKISKLDSEQCGWPWAWVSTGTRLFYNCPVAGPVWFYDAATGESRQIMHENIFDVAPSPDERWLAFQVALGGKAQVGVARFDGNQVAPEKDWISVPGDGDGAVVWSADGDLLYFVSPRDGYVCIWAQRLDPRTKQLAGPAFALYHSHGSRRSLSNVTGFDECLSVTGNRVAFVLGEQTGNLWIADWKSGK